MSGAVIFHVCPTHIQLRLTYVAGGQWRAIPDRINSTSTDRFIPRWEDEEEPNFPWMVKDKFRRIRAHQAC
jgi:hypothetical protein